MRLAAGEIAERLRQTYQPEGISSTDGYARLEGNTHWKAAAVLLPLFAHGGDWNLVFTCRTDAVEHHKGQVSFPGGASEAGDASPEETALREAREEIGLDPRRVRLLGRMMDVLTVSGYRVTPVVGLIPWPIRFHPTESEVRHIFSLPLAWLADEQNWELLTDWPDGRLRPFPVIRYKPVNGESLWGASARITHDFLTVVGLKKKQGHE